MAELLPNSPLTHTVFEIRFKPTLKVDADKHNFLEKHRKEFPNMWLPSHIGGGTNPILIPIQLTSEDNKDALKLSCCLFSFSTSKYQGFKKFKVTTMNLMNQLISKYKIKKLTRMGLLYRNQIPLDLDRRDEVKLNDYLQFGFKFPLCFGSNLQVFQTLFVHSYETNDLLKTVLEPIPRESNKTNTLSLDFDYWNENESDSKYLEKFLERGHDKIEECFNNIVSPEYFQYMKGGDIL